MVTGAGRRPSIVGTTPFFAAWRRTQFWAHALLNELTTCEVASTFSEFRPCRVADARNKRVTPSEQFATYIMMPPIGDDSGATAVAISGITGGPCPFLVTRA